MPSTISLQDILKYFKDAGWPIDHLEAETGRVFTSLRGRNVLLEVEVGLNQEWQLLQVTVTLPELVPSHRIAETLALINHVNYNLPIGHFELGVESRHIAYYAAMPINGLPYIQAQFETFLAWALDIVDEEHPRLMQVLYANTPAEEATTEGERSPQRRFDA